MLDAHQLLWTQIAAGVCLLITGGMLFNLIVGALLTAYQSYTLIFAISGLLHPLSFVIILLVVRNITPVINPKIYETKGAPI